MSPNQKVERANNIVFYLPLFKVRLLPPIIICNFINGIKLLLADILNYLGHSFLTPPNSDLLIGNFLGDHIKGKIKKTYPEFIQEGIRLHRFIDSYTDSHPIIKEHCGIMEPKLGHLSGVATDMIYDYILGFNWNDFAEGSLETFTQKTYAEILEHKACFPEKFEFMFRYMRRDNWLLAYSTKEGMLRALNGLSRRIRFENNLPIAWDVFKENEEEMTSGFKTFVSEIQSAIAIKFE